MQGDGPLQIYLLRHGIAEDAPAGKRDGGRALTAEGRKKLRGILKCVKEAGVAPGLILTSPYVRALQTAELAQAGLSPEAMIARTQALTPDADPQDAWEEIRLHRDQAQILCSSHEPLCGRLTAHLLQCPELQIDFKKGAIVRIDAENFGPRPKGVLKWMLSPKLA